MFWRKCHLVPYREQRNGRACERVTVLVAKVRCGTSHPPQLPTRAATG
jgi:hypothetical protein